MIRSVCTILYRYANIDPIIAIDNKFIALLPYIRWNNEVVFVDIVELSNDLLQQLFRKQSARLLLESKTALCDFALHQTIRYIYEHDCHIQHQTLVYNRRYTNALYTNEAVDAVAFFHVEITFHSERIKSWSVTGKLCKTA